MRVSFDVAVPMSDGTVLRADVQVPDGDGPFPSLLQRVPYDKSQPGIRDGALDTTRAVRRGYAVVTQDCRGRFSSGGRFTPFVDEAADGVDTLRWIGEQPWSDGTFGMFGRSYSAFLQWQTAALHPEGLRAIAPMFSGANPVRDWFGGDGPLEWGFVVFWALRHLAPDALRRDGIQPVTEATVDILLHESGDAVQALPWLSDWLDDDRRGKALSELDGAFRPAAEVEVPAFVVAGWYDLFLRGTLDAAGRTPTIGPWPHGGANPGVFPEFDFGPTASAAAIGLTDRQLDWFDHHVRGIDNGVTADARWFHRGAGWTTGPEWPPPGDARTLFLGADGRLTPTAGDAGPRTLLYDDANPVPTVGGNTFLPGLEVAANAGPRDQNGLLHRSDTLSWFGLTLTEPLDVVGAVRCVLDTDVAPGTRWVARLVERTALGRVMLVADGAALTADPAAVGIDLGPLAWRFEPGSSVGLILSHTSWPRYRRWVTDRKPGPDERGRGVSTVHTGRTSRLEIAA